VTATPKDVLVAVPETVHRQAGAAFLSSQTPGTEALFRWPVVGDPSSLAVQE